MKSLPVANTTSLPTIVPPNDSTDHGTVVDGGVVNARAMDESKSDLTTSTPSFAWKHDCLICAKQLKAKDKKGRMIKVSCVGNRTNSNGLTIQENIMRRCFIRGDELSSTIAARVKLAVDLFTVSAKYHSPCLPSFLGNGKTDSQTTVQSENSVQITVTSVSGCNRMTPTADTAAIQLQQPLNAVQTTLLLTYLDDMQIDLLSEFQLSIQYLQLNGDESVVEAMEVDELPVDSVVGIQQPVHTSPLVCDSSVPMQQHLLNTKVNPTLAVQLPHLFVIGCGAATSHHNYLQLVSQADGLQSTDGDHSRIWQLLF